MTEFITNCALPLAILFLVIGFVFLVKGADIFVEGNPAINLMEAFQENYKSILDGYFMSLGYKVN